MLVFVAVHDHIANFYFGDMFVSAVPCIATTIAQHLCVPLSPGDAGTAVVS